ncbi:hypothetical protein HYT57_00495 [Candidatus Woesearchaeota archaeon]|nr:hypothetical protein [Candidatus Woesearchaeota archaeon]
MEEKIEQFYDKHYKKLMIIPALILLLSLSFLTYNYFSNGEIIKRDVELKGGIEITIDKPGLTAQEVESVLSTKYEDFSVRELSDFSSTKSLGVTIKLSNVEESEVKSLLSSKISFTDNQYNSRIINAAFASSFYQSLIIVLIVSFILMALTVFIAFRTFIPSIAVISAASIDLIVTLAIVSFLGMKLSAPGITAFLLIIGYSIDTDVLLTTRMIKHSDSTLLKRMMSGIKTGLTMSFATIIAMIVALTFTVNPVLQEIFTIILIAIIIDIMATYLGNGPLLIWYAKKRGMQ